MRAWTRTLIVAGAVVGVSVPALGSPSSSAAATTTAVPATSPDTAESRFGSVPGSTSTVPLPDPATAHPIGHGVYVPDHGGTFERFQDGVVLRGSDEASVSYRTVVVDDPSDVDSLVAGEAERLVLEAAGKPIAFLPRTTYGAGYYGHDDLQVTEFSVSIGREESALSATNARVFIVVRDDGLAIVEVLRSVPHPQTEDQVSSTFASLAAAPRVGPVKPLAIYEYLPVDSPGEQIALPWDPARRVPVWKGATGSNDEGIVTVKSSRWFVRLVRALDVGSSEEALDRAEALLGTMVRGGKRSDERVDAEGDADFLERRTFGWEGGKWNGRAVKADAWVSYDPRTRAAIVAVAGVRQAERLPMEVMVLVDAAQWRLNSVPVEDPPGESATTTPG